MSLVLQTPFPDRWLANEEPHAVPLSLDEYAGLSILGVERLTRLRDDQSL